MSKTVTWYESDSRALADKIAVKVLAETKAGDCIPDDYGGVLISKPQLTSMIAKAIEEYIGK